jgi:hypothetical protein
MGEFSKQDLLDLPFAFTQSELISSSEASSVGTSEFEALTSIDTR